MTKTNINPDITAEDTIEELLDDIERIPVGIWQNLGSVPSDELLRIEVFALNLRAAVQEEMRCRANIFPASGHAICPVCFTTSAESELRETERADEDETTTYIWGCPACDEAADYRKWGLSQNRLASREVKLWNKAIPKGEAVDYFSYPGATPERCTTSGEAFTLEGHTACVNLNEKTGAVAVRACVPVNHAWLTRWLAI